MAAISDLQRHPCYKMLKVSASGVWAWFSSLQGRMICSESFSMTWVNQIDIRALPRDQWRVSHVILPQTCAQRRRNVQFWVNNSRLEHFDKQINQALSRNRQECIAFKKRLKSTALKYAGNCETYNWIWKANPAPSSHANKVCYSSNIYAHAEFEATALPQGQKGRLRLRNVFLEP